MSSDGERRLSGRDSRRLAEISFDRTADAMFVIREDGRFVHVNESACRSLKMDRAELLELRVFDIDVDSSEETWPARWQALRGEGLAKIESMHRRKDGSEFPVEVSVHLAELDDQEYCCAIVRSLSERRAAEQRLLEREELYAAIVRSSLDGIVTIDAEGRFLEFNPAAEAMFGHSSEAVLGQHMTELIIPERFRKAHETGLSHYLKTGEGPVLNRRIELPALHADGHEFPIEISIHPIEQPGRPPRFTAAVRDVTDAKRAADELLRARDEAEQASRYKSVFLASVSHEIRTPMTAVVGYAQLLAGDAGSREEQLSWRRLLRANSEYLLSLVNDVLDLSSIEAGRLAINAVWTDTQALIDDVILLFRPRAEEKGLELLLRLPSRIPARIKADPIRLRQVLVNLLSNAIKYTQSGSITLSADWSPSDVETEGEMTIEVIDTGPGIAEADRERIFERFARLGHAPDAVAAGAGLGLTICRQLARLFGGDVTVSEGEAGSGSCFRIRVPLMANAEAGWLDEGMLKWRDDTPPTGVRPLLLYGCRVLIVDDNADNRTIARYMLEEAGAVCDEVVNGAQAVEAVAAAQGTSRSHDLVLMDMNMPKLDGYEATRRLRSAGYSRPIIALTAYAMSDDEGRCREAGCDAYVSKPIDAERLFGEIRALLPTKTASSLEALPSPLCADPAFRALVAGYRQRLPLAAANLRDALAVSDTEAVRANCHKLKGTGSSYGFPAVTSTAGELESRLRDGAELSEVEQSVRELADLLESLADA